MRSRALGQSAMWTPQPTRLMFSSIQGSTSGSSETRYVSNRISTCGRPGVPPGRCRPRRGLLTNARHSRAGFGVGPARNRPRFRLRRVRPSPRCCSVLDEQFRAPLASVWSPSGPARQATHSGSYAANRRDRCLERRDALGRRRRGLPCRRSRSAGSTAQRERNSTRGRPAAAEQCDVRVVVIGQLELPNPDRVEAGSRVGRDVFRERRVGRRHLRGARAS